MALPPESTNRKAQQKNEIFADVIGARACNCHECIMGTVTDFMCRLDKSEQISLEQLQKMRKEEITQLIEKNIDKDLTQEHPPELVRILILYSEAQEIKALCPYHTIRARLNQGRKPTEKRKEETPTK